MPLDGVLRVWASPFHLLRHSLSEVCRRRLIVPSTPCKERCCCHLAASSMARRTFYHNTSYGGLTLPCTGIYSLRRPLHHLNCKLIFLQVNTLPLPWRWTPMLFLGPCDKQYFGETDAGLNKRRLNINTLYQGTKHQCPLLPPVRHRPSDGLVNDTYFLPIRLSTPGFIILYQLEQREINLRAKPHISQHIVKAGSESNTNQFSYNCRKAVRLHLQCKLCLKTARHLNFCLS